MMRFAKNRCAQFALALVLSSLVAGPASAEHFKLVGVDFIGSLYDISTSTGAASNPRSLGVSFPVSMIGIAAQPNTGTLFSISSFGNSPQNNSLFTIDVLTGHATTVARPDYRPSPRGTSPFSHRPASSSPAAFSTKTAANRCSR